MAQLSAEAILISALLNNADVASAASFGISPVHFQGYQAEYNWLLNYLETYGTEPSKDAFIEAFPSFRFSDHEDVRSAVDMVFKAHGKRELITAIDDAMSLIGVGDISEAHLRLVKAEPRRTAPKPRRLLTDTGFLDHWADPLTGVEVPYPTLANLTGGIRPGNLWYLAARPGQGKTAHLVNMATYAMLKGNRVMFYSLEMSEMEVRFRFHATLARHFGYDGINLTDLRDRRVDLETYKTFVNELNDKLAATGGWLDVHTPKDGPVSPSIVATRAGEYHLNVVDYIGLMKADDGSPAVMDWRVAAQISNSLKEIGLANQTGVLCAAQINREGDTGTGPPKVKNLAQSDALGQDGDVVLTARAKAHNVATHFLLDKNRHGPSGVEFFTTFDPNVGVYSPISREEAEDMTLLAEERAML